MSENDVICDHSKTCGRSLERNASNRYCSGEHPHRYNHEECNGFHCPYADGAWVTCVKMYVRNPASPYES